VAPATVAVHPLLVPLQREAPQLPQRRLHLRSPPTPPAPDRAPDRRRGGGATARRSRKPYRLAAPRAHSLTVCDGASGRGSGARVGKWRILFSSFSELEGECCAGALSLLRSRTVF
jgi:hypothetical protein